MYKIKKIFLCLFVSLLLLPTTVIVYATEVEEVEEIEESTEEVDEENISLYAYSPAVFGDTDRREVAALDKINDFFVSVCLYDCYETGYLDDTSNVFVFINMYSDYGYPDIHIYNNFHFNKNYLSGYYDFKIYDTSNIFMGNLFVQDRSSGSGGTTLFSDEVLKNIGNTSPFKCYSTVNFGDEYNLRELPEPMSLEDAYSYYFESGQGDTNITFVDFSETNKILNNIFILIVFTVIYAWFLNPTIKILRQIKGE